MNEQTEPPSQNKKQLPRGVVYERLIVATLKAMEHSGIQGVKAREIAKEAGCSVGTIYNLVGDLDNLVLLACARTMEEFRDFAIERFEKAKNQNATQRHLLAALAEAYIDFVSMHKKRWQANFEISVAANNHYFNTYVEAQHRLLGIIVVSLKEIAGNTDERELFAIARALLGAVHGIAMLAMSNPTIVIPREKILEQCHRIIDPVIASLRETKPLEG